NPETTWEFDRSALGRLGLSVPQASEQLSDAWLGDVKTELQLPDRTIPVRVRYPDAYRLDPVQMASTPIRADDGRAAPFSAVATPTTTDGEIILAREHLRQVGLLTRRLG